MLTTSILVYICTPIYFIVLLIFFYKFINSFTQVWRFLSLSFLFRISHILIRVFLLHLLSTVKMVIINKYYCFLLTVDKNQITCSIAIITKAQCQFEVNTLAANYLSHWKYKNIFDTIYFIDCHSLQSNIQS